MKYDREWIASARMDLLAVLGNLPKVKTAHDVRVVVDGVRVYFRRVLGGYSSERDLGRHGTVVGLLVAMGAKKDCADAEGRARIVMVVEGIGSALWPLVDVLSEFLDFSRAQEPLLESGVRTVGEWKAAAVKFKDRASRAARKLWDVFATYADSRPDLLVAPNLVTRTKIAGFDVLLEDYDPENDPVFGKVQRRLFAETTEALTRFRRRAALVMPVMLRKVVPFHVKLDLSVCKAGSYHAGRPAHINLYVHPVDIDSIVRVIAHEMGHHLYNTLLSSAERDDWNATIHGYRVEMRVQEILERWPKALPGHDNPPWAIELSKYTLDDPIFGLRMEAVARRYRYYKKEDFEALLTKGITTVNAPETPITGYAEKNPEEAFCEAVGLLVAYGTQAVHPRVRHWLDVVLGSAVTFGRVAGRRRRRR